MIRREDARVHDNKITWSGVEKLTPRECPVSLTLVVLEIAGAEVHVEQHENVVLLLRDIVRHEDPVVTVRSEDL